MRQFLLFFTLLSCCWMPSAFAQNLNLANGTFNQCNGTFLDPGGNGNFGNNQNITGTVCGTAGQCIVLEFNSFDLGSSGDNLFVYDGPTTASPLVGTYTGAGGPGVVGSTSGCVTFRFVSNGTGVAAGWSASISCHNCYQYPGCPLVNAGTDQSIPCPGSCVTLTAVPTQTAQTTSYSVGNIPYTPLPYNKGTDLLVGIDDIFSGVLNLGFNFCFYGNTYSQCVLGANGLISFNTALANQFNIWDTGGAIPNAGDHTNLIACPYHDIDPSVQNRPNYINFEVVGTAPCRVAKFSWNRVPMFSCNSVFATQEILLYETTNVIETYIHNKPTCTGWNGGEAIHGVENAAGTVATAVPGRNFPTQWTASLDAKRFTPSGAAAYTITWFQGATQVGTGASISVCPTVTTTYTARVVYTRCDGNNITVSDDVVVTVGNGNVNVSIAPPPQVGCTVATSQIQLSASSSSPAPTYVWSTSGGNIVSGGNTATPTVNAAGTYIVTVTSAGCTATSSVVVAANNQIPVVNIAPPPTLQCNTPSGQIQLNASGTTPAGMGFSWAGPSAGTIVSGGTTATPTINAAGTYNVTVTNPANGCTALGTVTINSNTTAPDLSVSPPDVIDCNTAGGQTSLSAISSVNGATFVWNGPGVNGSTGSSVTVSQQGSYGVVVTNPANGCTASASTNITLNTTQPTVTINPPPTVACNVPPAGVVLSANGSAGVTYSWSGPGIVTIASNTANINQPGTYSVIVTDPSNGCTASASVNVPANSTPPTVSITPPPVIGCGATVSVQLSASGPAGATYQWVPPVGVPMTGSTTATPTVTQAGTYTVVVTDVNGNGCTNSASVTVIVDNTPPTVNIAQPPPITCGNTATGIQLSASGPAGAAFVWSGTGIISGGNTATPTVNGTGPYTVVVTNTAGNGCTNSASVSVTINNTPPAVNIAQPPPITCGNTATGIQLSASGPAGATFVWSGTGIVSGGNTATPTVNGTGPYSVVVTDAAGNGCTNSASVSVTIDNTPPTVSIAPPPQLTCAGTGTQATLTANGPAGATYTWATSGGSIVSGGNTATPTINGAGTYTVTVTNTAGNGCTNSASTTVTVNNQPPDVSIAPVTPITCSTPGQQITLNASSSVAGAQFAWTGAGLSNPNIANPTVGAASGGGSYTVVVTNPANGCTNQATVVVTINNIPPDVLIAPPPIIDCSTPGGQIVLSASSSVAGVQFAWTGAGIVSGANTASPTVNGTGPYNVVVTDPANACTGSATVTVVVNNTQPSISVTPPPPIDCSTPNGEITLFATSSAIAPAYQWATTGGTIVSGATTDSPIVSAAGTYSVTVTDMNNGCTNQTTVTVTENINPPPVSIAPPPILNCNIPNLELTITASTSIANPQYLWDGPAIVSGITSASLVVNGPGTYTVVVTDPANGCTNSASIAVVADLTPPDYNLVPPPVLDCTSPSTNLTLGISSNTAGVTYQWASMGQGNVISGATTTAPLVSAPGVYGVTITNPANGCFAFDVVNVIADLSPPDVSVTPPTTITCNSIGGQELLTASSTVASVTYQWTASGGGNIIPPSNQAAIFVDAAGTYQVVVTALNGCTASASTTVVVAPPPSTSVSGAATVCSGQAVTLNATGGPFVSYSWSNGMGSPSITVNPTNNTSYSVTVTDSFGCTASAAANVPVNQPPQPAISGSLSFCLGGSTVLDAGTGYVSYLWSPGGSSNQSITASSAGAYSVVVTDANGCTGSTSVQVVVNSVLTPNITGDLSVCEGTTTELNAGTGFTDYIWSNGGQGQFVTVPAGTYIVTVTGGAGCTGTGTVTVVQTPNPQPQISGNPNICTGQTTVLSAGNFAQYNWGNSFNPTLTVSTGGTYSVTVTDAEGCTGSDNFVVTENPNPDPTISGNMPFCQGTSITLEADAGYQSYQWTPGNGNAQTHTANTAATYTVVVTDVNGCTGSESVVTTVQPLPTPQITGDLSICMGETTNLGVNNAFDQYQWSNNSNLDQINVGGGNYSVTVSDVNGCTGSASATVTETNAAIPILSGDTNICDGQSTTINVAGLYSAYMWDDGSAGSSLSISPITNSTYSVTVSDANGCTAENSINVLVNPNPVVEIGGSLSFCTGGNTTLTANNPATGGTFPGNLWGGSGAGNSPSLFVTQSGNYTVLVTDANGCTATDAVSVIQANQLSPVVTGGGPICAGTSATLNAGAGFASYQWSANANSATSQTVSVNQSGTYTVTVSDGSCSGTGSTTVTVNPNPTPTIQGQTTICLGSSTALTTTTPFAAYSWAHNGSSSFGATLTATEAGLYTVTVTDANSCTGTDDFTITLNNNLSPQITGDLDFCDGSSSTLSADAGYASYLWSSSATTQTINVSTAGTYSVLVSDAGGCTGTTAVVVSIFTNPLPNITGTLAFCAGENTILDAGNFNAYQWSTNAGSANSQTVTVTSADTYTVTVTDANGCTGTDATTTVVNSAQAPFLIGDTEICEGTCSDLEVTGNYTNYQWSANANNATTANVQVCPSNNATYSVTVTDANGCTNEGSINVSINANPLVTIGGSTTFCTGTTTTLDAGVGTAWVWSNGADTQTLVVDASDTYCVVVTNANGCTGSACIDVTESSSLNPVITGITEICQGETSTLNAGAFDAYTWSSGQNTQTIDVNAQGTYCVTVSNGSGCTGSACVDVVVNQNPLPAISGVAALCDGLSTTLDAGVFEQYTWSDNSLNSTLSVSTGGNYSVTVTDVNGCTGSDAILVSFTPNPTPDIIGDQVLCAGENSLLDAGAYSSWQWSDGLGNIQTVSVSASGAYSVTVTDANGCTGTDDISITVNTPIDPTFSGMMSVCENACTDITVDGVYTDYDWSSNAGGAAGATANLCPLQSDTYTVTVTDANTCTSQGSFNILVNPLPDAQISGSLSFCTGGFTTLSSAGYEEYLWTGGSTESSIQVSTGGNYSVTVTDQNGCIDETNVNVIESNVLTPQITGDLTICQGETTTLDAGAGFNTYSWQPGGEVTSSIVVSQAGTYTVSVSDLSGCSGTGEATVVVNANPVPVIDGLAAICENGTSTLSTTLPYDSYIWEFGGQTSFGTNLDATQAGAYSVTVTDSNGCTGTDTFNLVVNQNLSPQITGDPDVCADTQITIDAGAGYATYEWSNSDDTQTISPTQSGNYSVTVTDINGCSGTDAIQVTVFPMPQTDIDGTLNFCIGASSTLDAGTGFDSYAWTPSGNTQTITVVDAGNYSVLVTDGNGCTASDAVIVTTQDCNCTVPPIPVAQVQDIEICEGVVNADAFVLTTASNTIVQWYDGADPATATLLATGTSFVPDSVGTYFAFAQNDPIDDCISAGVPFTFSTKPLPVAAAALADANVCVGETSSVEFTGTAQVGASYQWSFGTGANPATATGAGAHNVSWTTTGNKTVSVTVTDNGCTDIATANIGVSATTAAITPTSITISGGSGTVLTAIGTSALNGDLTYEWSPSNTLSCADCPTPTATPEETSVYDVLIVDEYGCEASASATVNVTFENIVVIPNAFTPNSNAPNNLFRVHGINIAEVYLEIRNRWGNKIYAETFSDLATGWDGFYKSKECEIGTYVFFATVRFNDGTEEFFKGNVTLIR